MESSNKYLNYLGTFLLVIIVFIIGFYYGFRYHENNFGGVDLVKLKDTTESLERVEVKTKEVEGIFWIKSGEDPICPNTHPVKIKYDSGVCFFYTKENRSYSRVKAHVCSATEDFAKNQMGCLKKF